MAKATAHCTCERCGSEFIKEKTCHNRREADDYEAWAERNITVCPECYRTEMAEIRASEMAKRKEALKAIILPAIEGVSEKQKRYAESLRSKVLYGDYQIEKKLDLMNDLIDGIDLEKLDEICGATGETRETVIVKSLKHYGLDKIYIALHYEKAGDIIKALK